MISVIYAFLLNLNVRLSTQCTPQLHPNDIYLFLLLNIANYFILDLDKFHFLDVPALCSNRSRSLCFSLNRWGMPFFDCRGVENAQEKSGEVYGYS